MPSRRNRYLDGEMSTLKITSKLEIGSQASFIGAETLPSQTGNSGKFLTTDGTSASWAALAGGGDMAAATYDPGGISANVYDTDNHVDGSTNGVYTLTERAKLAGIAASATVNSVTSVFGRGGAVTAQNNDYTWAQINKATSDLADITTKSHTSLTDKGTYTHAQIDTNLSNSIAHIANTSNPHSVDIDDVTPTTTKGDIIVENGTNAVRLGIGTNGHVLTADSGEATGVKWAAQAGGGDMAAATYDPASISEQLVGITAAQTITSKYIMSSTIRLKQGTAPAPTVEGDIQWDTDDDKIKIGDGSGTKTFSDDAANALSYAPIAKGVTNGDSHDHNGGDGAQIDHVNLANKGTYTHAQIDTNLSNSVAHIANTSNPHSVAIGQVSPLTTKGDIMYHNGSISTRLGIGSDGQILIVDSDVTSWSSSPYDVDNHVNGTTNKVFTASEQSKLAGIATGADSIPLSGPGQFLIHTGTAFGVLTVGASNLLVMTDSSTASQFKFQTLETSLTDDDTKVPSSGGVVDYVAEIGINSVATSTYELVLTDRGKLVTLTGAGAGTVTIPSNASTTYSVGTQIELVQTGAGTITVAITADTLYSSGSKVALAGQYSSVVLTKITTTAWLMAGDLV